MKPYYEADGISIYHGDCREIMPGLAGIGLIVTDPPYLFGLASTAHDGKAGGWADMMNAAGFYAEVLRTAHGLLANQQGALWMFNSWRSFPVLARAAFEARWPIESLLVWDKGGIGPGGCTGLRPCYELAALFACDGFRLANRSLRDIWPVAQRRETEHPSEKPVALLERLLVESGRSPVLDCFAGSGSTLVAAKQLGSVAIGIEAEERWCEVAARRLDAAIRLPVAPSNPASSTSDPEQCPLL